MPGEQPRRPPPSTMTGDLPPCRVASSLGHPSQPPCENPAVASGTAQGAREAGNGTRATEPREAQPRQAGEVEAKALLLSAQNLGGTPGKRGSPQVPAARSHAQTRLRLAGKVGSSPQQHCSLSIINSRPETPKDPHREVPESPGPAPHLRPGPVSAGAPPAPEELSFERCFQGDPSVCTSTDSTSLAATPGSPPLRDPQGHGASPHRPASYPTFPAGQAGSWPPAAGSSFPGANLGVSLGEPEPFPKGNRPGGSPRGGSFQFPFPELRGAGAKPFPAEMAMPEYTEGTLVLAFHQATGVWPDGALGTGPACPPPTQPAPPLPWYPGQPGGLDAPSELGGTLPPPSAAPPSPFSDSLHESLTKVLPERPPSTCSRMGSPRGPPNPLPQRHLLGPAYRPSGVGTSLGPLDPELATSGPTAVRLSQLWDPPAASYPVPPLGPPATARSMFSDRQPSPGRQLCLPQGLPLPWPQGLPTRGPGPHQMDTVSQRSFPAGTPEWQGACRGTLGAGDKREGPGQSAGPPGLFTHTGLKDRGTQPLFRAAQPQPSPRGTPRVVGASPRESPLPSPATSTASSACSSLSPPSSSPANPSSEEGQLPGPLVPSAFFHAPTHSQETGSPFQSPDPSHYQPEPAKTFRFPVDGLVAEGAFQGLDEVGRAGPTPYTAAHFPLSSASLDQLDVLLTCRQCDRAYGSLAAFLAHRQFCGLLLARAKDGPPGLPDAPGAHADVHAGPLSQAKMAPFPAAGGTQGDGRDDPLRTSLLPGLAAPFPLPASDLDPEDDAKLDSLITEALNGMEHQPGSLEIDSSFIDVFTDEEPSGPRGPGPGQLPKARAGATAEGRGQAPVTAAGLEPQTSYAGDKGCPARSRPKTRSLGPVPMEVAAPIPPAGLGRRQRRGKQFKVFREELDGAVPAKGPGRGPRAASLRPRRKDHQAERLPARSRDLRMRAPRSRTDPEGQVSRASNPPGEPRGSRRPRLPPRKDRKRRARGGTWNKELIHKIVLQKNRPRHGPPPLASQGPLVHAVPDSRSPEWGCASESEEDTHPPQEGSGVPGRHPRGCPRWRRGEKKVEVEESRGPRAEGGRQRGRTVGRRGAGQGRDSPSPEEAWGTHAGAGKSLEAREAPVRGGPARPAKVPTHTEAPEESCPSQDGPQKAEVTEEASPGTTDLRGAVSAPPDASQSVGLGSPAPGRPPPGHEDTSRPEPSRGLVSPGTGGLRGAVDHHDREDSPAHRPEQFLTLAASAAPPEPQVSLWKNASLDRIPSPVCGDSVGAPAAKRGHQPQSSAPSELFLGPKDLAGCFPKDLDPKSLATVTGPASSTCLCQHGVDMEPLKPRPPKNPPYMAGMAPGQAQSPLTLEPTCLFSGLALDVSGPPLYGSLCANRDRHAPVACTGPPLRTVPLQPPVPSFLLLDEGSPTLPGHFLELSGEKALGKKHPCAGTAAPSPPPGPGKGSEYSVSLRSSLSEDELAIQRLVTELERELRRGRGAPGAPGDPGEAQRAGRVGSPLPAHRAASCPGDAFPAGALQGLQDPNPHELHAERTMATAPRSPRGERPQPTPAHHGGAALAPGTHASLVSGAPFSPTGTSLGFQPVHKARFPETGLPKVERDCEVSPAVCSPDPNERQEPLLGVGGFAKCSPNGTQESQELSRLLPRGQRGGLVLEPGTVDRPYPDPPALVALGSPAAHLASDPVLQSDVTPLHGASHSHASQGRAADTAGAPRGAGLPHPAAEHPGSEGGVLTATGPSWTTARQGGEAHSIPALSRTCVPDAGPGRGLQDPALSPLRHPQLLGAGAAENEGDTWELPPPKVQSLPPGAPSGLAGGLREGGDVAPSPAQDSSGGVQVAAALAMARRRPGPEAGGLLGWCGLAEGPEGQGQASWLQPDSQGRPGGRAVVGTDPAATLAGPTRGADVLEELEGSGASSPATPERESWLPASAAHPTDGPVGSPTETVPGPGPGPLLLPQEGPAPAPGSLGPCAPLPSTVVPQGDPPTVPSEAAGAPGKLRRPLPTSLSYRDPRSALHLLPCPFTWAPPWGAPCLTANPCEPEEVVAHSLATGDGSPLEDPPTRQPGFIEALKPACRVASPREGTLRTREDSRKERPRRGPAAAAPGPVGGRPLRAAAGLSTLSANNETETAKGPRGPCPRRRGSLPPSPDGVPKDPSDLPSNTGHLGPRDSHSVPDLTTPGATEPDSHACPEGEAGPSSEGQEHPGMPESGSPGLAKVPRVGSRGQTVTCPSARLRPDRAAPPGGTAPDVSRDALRHMPRRNPRGPQDPQQRPRGFTKKLLSTEKGRAPDGLPATCDVCAASFRSRPGLSRHKARKHRLQPLPDLPAPQPSEPKAQLCQPPGVDHQVPRRERPAHSPIQDPGHAAEDASEFEAWVEGRQGLGVPGTRGCPPSQQPDPHGRTRRELGVNAATSVTRRPAQPRTERAAQREGPRRGSRPVDSSSDAEGPSGKRGRLRARRARAQPAPRVSPDAISDRRSSGPSTAITSYPAPLRRCLSPSPEGEPGVHVGPKAVKGTAEMGPGAPCAEETQAQEAPGDGRIHPGRTEGASPRERPAKQRGASARGIQGPRDRAPGTCKQLSRAAGSTTTKGSTGTKSEPGDSLGEEHVPPLGPAGPPESSGSEAASTFSSCAQGDPHSPEALAGVQGPEGAAPRPPGSGLGDPLSLFDDEVSFSQLFPLGGRLTRKKNPRVYGKRCRKPKHQPLPEPCSEAGDSAVQPSACLPMDLSDSGSLCLSQEDLWDDEATGLPESFLLDGLLGGKLPGMTSWAPCSSPWVPEPTRETSRAEGVPSHCAEAGPESIPELHVVPAAWRGLELRAPAVEAPHSLGDVSPEPPNLEREHYDGGVPTGASPMPLHTTDFEMLGPKVPVRDLCFLGACEDPVGAPSTSCFDPKAMGSPQGPQGRTEGASGRKRAEGRDRPAKGRRAPYKCRVCFQRFHGLAERDAHRLAHSPAPPPTCYMCVQRRFGSRELLREHLQEKHAQGRPGLWACGMCLKEVADVWMYNEHLREHATRFARRAPAWGPPGGLAPLPARLCTPARPLNGIAGQTSRRHKCKHPKGGTGGSPTKLSQPEGNAEEETPGEGVRPMVRPAPSGHDAACVPDGSPAGVPASSPAALSGSPSPSPDAWCGSEPLLQAAQVHEDCKDPSRDCHHCGKRFPKPFKLQRHLAVHSPQRVYLCPRCPRVYPEHRELRAHLGGAHGVVEGPEPHHTPLYACELCANVMHVIRRSFACSSCNYTFAKKEQFDRHMDKHPRAGRQPFTFRGVRRPGAAGQRAPTPEGVLPSKQPRLRAPGSTLEPQACGPLQGSSPTLSEEAPPALPRLCVDVAPREPEGPPATQERPTEPAGLAVRGPGPPPDLRGLPAQFLSPSPTARADGKGGSKGGAALQHTVPPQALPGTGTQDVAARKAQHLVSRKHRPLAARGHSPEGLLLLQEEKQVSSNHVVLGGTWGGPSHKRSASMPGNCCSSKDRPTPAALPEQLRMAVGSLAPGTPLLPRGAEHRPKPPTPKGRPGSSSRSTKAVGDIRPQPASGQLQREAATMTAKATSPGRSPLAGKPLSRAHTKTSRGSPGPSQRAEGSEERSKGLAPGPAGGDTPDKRPRPPRKQATPSRVLPAKPRPSSQHSRTKLRPSEQRRGAPGHTHGKEGLGEAFPRVRPLLRPSRRGRASHGAQPAHPRDCRTAASQSDLLNQLFGPRLTGFRIPLKKDASE